MSADSTGGTVRAVIPVGPKGVELKHVDAMFRFAKCYMQSGLSPASFKNEQQLVIAWAKAAELGLSPLQAVEGMTVINNRVGIMGDLPLAMVEASGLLELKRVEYSGEVDSLSCLVTLQRRGREAQSYSFSVKEAKAAGIYDRSPTWRQYPRRMTYYRALGFGLRDEFADVLKGTKTVEELMDYPPAEEPRVISGRQRAVRPAPLAKPQAAGNGNVAPATQSAPESPERLLLAQARKRLAESAISETEFLKILQAAQIQEAAQGALSEIPDKVLRLALESWDTVTALSEELREQKTEAKPGASLKNYLKPCRSTLMHWSSGPKFSRRYGKLCSAPHQRNAKRRANLEPDRSFTTLGARAQSSDQRSTAAPVLDRRYDRNCDLGAPDLFCGTPTLFGAFVMHLSLPVNNGDERAGFPSASEYSRLLACPASYLLSRKARALGQVAQERSEAADLGTKKHLASTEGPEILSPAEREDFETVQRKREQFIQCWADGSPIHSTKEARLWLRKGIRPLLSGQPDELLVQGKRCAVLDYKFGAYRVSDPGENLQLGIYALLAARSDDAIQEVTVRVLSPFYEFQPSPTAARNSTSFTNPF